MVRLALIRMPDAFNVWICDAVLLRPFDRLALSGYYDARTLGIGTPDCVIALVAVFNKAFFAGHTNPSQTETEQHYYSPSTMPRHRRSAGFCDYWQMVPIGESERR